jgi:hypothetical protein
MDHRIRCERSAALQLGSAFKKAVPGGGTTDAAPGTELHCSNLEQFTPRIHSLVRKNSIAPAARSAAVCDAGAKTLEMATNHAVKTAMQNYVSRNFNVRRDLTSPGQRSGERDGSLGVLAQYPQRHFVSVTAPGPQQIEGVARHGLVRRHIGHVDAMRLSFLKRVLLTPRRGASLSKSMQQPAESWLAAMSLSTY